MFVTNPQKLFSTYLASFHACLTIGPIRLFISFYSRAPWATWLNYPPTYVVKHKCLTTNSQLFLKNEWRLMDWRSPIREKPATPQKFHFLRDLQFHFCANYSSPNLNPVCHSVWMNWTYLHLIRVYLKITVVSSVTRLGNLLDFGPLFKAFGNI